MAGITFGLAVLTGAGFFFTGDEYFFAAAFFTGAFLAVALLGAAIFTGAFLAAVFFFIGDAVFLTADLLGTDFLTAAFFFIDLLAVAFLGEQIDFKFVVAAALIFAGVFFVIKKFTPSET